MFSSLPSGQIEVGSAADLTIIDLDTESEVERIDRF